MDRGNINKENKTHSEVIAIRRDSSYEDDQNVAAKNEKLPENQKLPDIFKLNIDCYEEAFDYLSLKNLVTVSKTCKWLHQVAGHCFQMNYPAAEVKWQNNSIYIRSSDKWISAKLFTPYIKKLCCEYMGDFEHFRVVKENCPSIKQIELIDVRITKAKIDNMKEILNKLESLRMTACDVEGDFHEVILAFCPNLKRLSMCSYRGLIGDDNNWLLQKYPTLEFFEIHPSIDISIAELKTFLELNPTIHKLRISAECLWKNRKSMLNASVTLDDLEILEIDFESDAFMHLLNELFDRKFYKRLSLNWWYFDQDAANKLNVLKALVILNAFNNENVLLDHTAVRNVEELYFFKCDETNLVDIASNLIKLQRIVFTIATFDDILQLMSRVKHLKKLKVEKLESGAHFSTTNNIINLALLNAEREKLVVAQKVTIYVNENIYLATKWATKQQKFRLVRIQRAESYEWDHAFRFIP